jgi:hypothetical protein
VVIETYNKKYYETHKAEFKEKRRQFTLNNPEWARRNHLSRKYGLTPERHKAMYLAQNGCCAICGESVPYDKVQTDHDHATGKVRGLLCCRCNMQIGIFDNCDLLERAISYLERF